MIEAAAAPNKPKRRDVYVDKFLGFFDRTVDRAATSPQFTTAAVLAAVACRSYQAQATGYTKELPSLLKHGIESGAHPFLGFGGAVLGYMAVKYAKDHEWRGFTDKTYIPLMIGAVALGVATADLLGEIAQGIKTKTNFEFRHHGFETRKDAAAAAIGGVISGGVGIYRRWKEK